MSAALDFQHQLSMAASTTYRLEHKGLKVDGEKLDFSLYPHLYKIIDGRAPETTIVKAAQQGLSIACILRAIEDQLQLKLRGTGYFFPTDDEVKEHAKARFDPVFEQYGLNSSVNTAGLKQVGNGFVWFRAMGQIGGAKQKSLSKVKSFPADKIYCDEADEMDPKRVDAARHRLDGASEDIAEFVSLSTPTIPDFGVDWDYKQSDQEAFHWRCSKCNEWVCLELTWPDCLADPSEGDAFYLCSKCREPLERLGADTEWVPARPDLEKIHRGFWVSQLSSLRRSPNRILLDLQKAEAKGRVKEFKNQVLAKTHADIEDVMTDALMNACLDRDRPRARSAAGPCAMGVDPGSKVMHYWIGERITDKDTRILSYGKVAGFDDIGQLAKKFHVKSGVMDIGAETRKVREFLDEHPGWWGCQYVEKKATGYDWNPREHIVTVGRTEALDASHDAILSKRTSLPAPDETYHDLVLPQMKNLARTKIEDDQTGNVTMKWVVTGGQKDDHLKHAHAYFQIATEKVGLAESVQRSMNARRGPARRRSAMTI